MREEVATLYLYLLRFVYLLSAVVVGLGAWPEVVRRSVISGDLIGGIAFSIYAAFSVLMLLGAFVPLRMLPLVLLQLLYKLIWIVGIGIPQWQSGHFNSVGGTIRFFAAIVVLDLVAVPWPYVFRQFIQAIGARTVEKTGPISA